MSQNASSYFLSLFSQLRNPETAERANAELMKVSQNLDYFPSLFFLFENTDDIIIQRYSLHTISMCIRQQSGNMSQEVLYFYRKKLIFYLKQAKNVETIDAILSVIQNSIYYTGGFWSELAKFAVQMKDNLYLSMNIFDMLIFTMFPPAVTKNIQIFLELILNGLRCDEFIIKIISVKFLFDIAPSVKNYMEVFGQFQIYLLNFFLQTINSNNISYLTQLVNIIFSGLKQSVLLFPLNDALNDIFSILNSNSYDISFKLILHNFFINSLCFFQIDTKFDNLNYMFLTEQNISVEYFLSNFDLDDDNLSRLIEINVMLNFILKNIEPNKINEFVYTYVNKYMESDNTELIEFSYLVWESALLTSLNLFEDNLDDIFDNFMKGFRENGTLKQKIAAYCFDSLAHLFKKQINENLIMINEAILIYTCDVDAYLGTSLLCKTINQVENTDLIFSNSLAISHELISHPNLQIKIFSLSFLSLIIHNSVYQSIILFDQIFKSLIDIMSSPISFESPYSLVYDCVSGLTKRAPEKMIKYLPEVTHYFIQGFNSSDPNGAIEIIESYISILKIMKLNMPFLQEAFDALYKRVNKNWTELLIIQASEFDNVPITFYADTLALQALAKICKLINQKQANEIVFEQIMSLAGLFSLSFCIYPTMKSFNSIVYFLEPDQRLIGLLQQCFNFFLISTDYDNISVILVGITRSLILFGVDVFGKENCINLVKRVLTLISSQDSQNFNQHLLNQFQISLPIIIKQTYSETFINEIFNYFLQLFQEPTFPNADLFSIEIITTFVTEMPNYFLQNNGLNNIFPILNSLILEGKCKLATASASFVFNVILHLNEETFNLFIPYVNDFFSSLNQRLVIEQSVPSILRETIVAALSVIGIYILKNQFPFNDVLSLIIQSLPIQNDLSLCYYVYSFISIYIDKINECLLLKVLHIFIQILSQPYSNVLSMKIGLSTWKIIVQLIKDIDDSEILKILNNDQLKLSFYHETLNSVIKDIN